VAFQPLRRRLESLADQWVFGERVNRYQLLTAFGATLAQTPEPAELLPRLADAVRRGLGADWVRVSLSGTHSGLEAVAGKPFGSPELTVGLERGAELVGQIACGPKDGGYDPADRELLTTLGRQAATAIANVLLTAQLAERLDELDRSRGRIVAAQDAERRRIERNIHDGVQQEVVALITKLRLARNQLGRGERSPEAVLSELQADVRELLIDLRELAHGIHPPVLSDGGLVAAVQARADRLQLPVAVRAEPSLHTRRLGEEVEGAAYFVICEALTNVVKHAVATEAEVLLSTVDGRLEIVVRDDGRGLGAVNGHGVGLVNLRDRVEALGGRLRMDSQPGNGTSVQAELPLERVGNG
jgi:signal transduction histidine kinase